MQLDECVRCRSPESECECICPECKRVFYDGRPIIVDGVKIYLLSTDSPCTLCRKCINCGGSVAEGRRLSIRLPNGTRLTSCSKSGCLEYLRRHPEHLEQKKSQELRSDDLESGPSTIRFADAFVTSFATPEAFGMPPEQPVVFKSRLIRELVLTIWDLLYAQKGRNLPLVEPLRKILLPALEFENRRRRRHAETRIAQNRQRQMKYPDEKDYTNSYRAIDSKTMNGSKLLTLINNHLNLHRQELVRTMARQRFPSEEDLAAYYPMNASWRHLCRCILMKRRLDGMQPILIKILKNWFAMGLYPSDRKDFLDIQNPRVKMILTDYLQNLGWNGHVVKQVQNANPPEQKAYNADQTECVVCGEDFDVLVRLQPCGHRLFCKVCSTVITQCYVCMTVVTDRVLVPRD